MKRLPFIILIALVLASCGDNHFATWRGFNDKWYDDYRANHVGEDTNVVRHQVLPSGVIIESYHDGFGAIPKATTDPVLGKSSDVYVTMEGFLADGSLFLMKGTTSYALSDLIPGLCEAFKLMRQGSHWKVTVPYSMGYDDEGSTGSSNQDIFNVPPYSVLIFDIELIDVTNY